MQAFTKIEIKWIIDELEAEIKQLKSLSAVETGAARSLYILRAEQLDVDALLTAVNRIMLMDEKSGEFEAGDGNQNMVTFEVSE